jgi:hypothetical protein
MTTTAKNFGLGQSAPRAIGIVRETSRMSTQLSAEMV